MSACGIKLLANEISASSCSPESLEKDNKLLFSGTIQVNGVVERGRTQDPRSALTWPLGGGVTPWGPCLLPAPSGTRFGVASAASPGWTSLSLRPCFKSCVVSWERLGLCTPPGLDFSPSSASPQDLSQGLTASLNLGFLTCKNAVIARLGKAGRIVGRSVCER